MSIYCNINGFIIWMDMNSTQSLLSKIEVFLKIRFMCIMYIKVKCNFFILAIYKY